MSFTNHKTDINKNLISDAHSQQQRSMPKREHILVSIMDIY